MTVTADAGEVCIINIGPKERRKRMISGVVLLGVGLVIGAAMYRFAESHYWRLLLFLPFMGAATGYFQARDKT